MQYHLPPCGALIKPEGKMKKLGSLLMIIAFILMASTVQAQVAVSAQDSRVDASIEVLHDISVVGSYSTQNNIGDYVAVGAKYRKQLDYQINPVFSVQGQYGIGTYTQARSQEFLTDQKEFEFVFSYSAFGGIAIKDFDVGLALNQHFGVNRDIWISPSISYRF